MKKSHFNFKCCLIFIFLLFSFLNMEIIAIEQDMPMVISLSDGSLYPDNDKDVHKFLKYICNDIYEKSGEKFIPVLPKIGEGGMSKVYRLKSDKENLCVKVFKQKFSRLPKYRTEEQEFYYRMSSIKYSENFLIQIRDSKLPNVCFPVAAYRSGEIFANITKYSNLCELRNLIAKKVVLNEKMVATIMYELLNGLKSLHNAKDNKSYCHRDIVPQNIVINYPSDEKIEINIIDAGSICEKNNLNCNFLCCDNGYREPEDVFDKNSIVNDKSDIFAVGVIMWELLHGSCPFAGMHSSVSLDKCMPKWKESLNNLDKNKNLSPNCKDLLSKILSTQKYNRISAEEALKHDFLKNKKPVPKKILLKLIQG